MMLSPETYLENCKNMTFEELIKERDTLVEEMRSLEQILLKNDIMDEAWHIRPTPDVVYAVYLEYLEKLCKFMRKKGRKGFDS